MNIAVALLGLIASTLATDPVVIKGQRMFKYSTGAAFQVKGVDYYPRPNAGILNINNYDFFTDANEAIWAPHIAQFAELGVNAIRLYSVDPSQSHDKFMCALEAIGVYVLVDLAASCEGCAVTLDPFPTCYPSTLKTRGQQIIVAFSKYNNVLGFSAGNEVNNVVADSKINAPCQKKFLRDMRAFINSCNKAMRPIPIGVVLSDFQRGPNALYYNCRTDPTDTLENTEWYGLNAYLQCDADASPTTAGPGYEKLLSDFTSYKMSVPVMLTEFGCLNVGFPTVDGYQAQRTWLDAGWLLSDTFSSVFAGGLAFEFSTENANSAADSPYPFTKFGTQNYGLGYFSPATCDARETPCVYNRMPNYGFLATKYNASNEAASMPSSASYVGYNAVPPACPAGFAALSSVTWAADAVTDMLCPDLTATPLCPGDTIIAGNGKVIAPLSPGGNTVAPGGNVSPGTNGGAGTVGPVTPATTKSAGGAAQTANEGSDASFLSVALPLAIMVAATLLG
ncbi:glycoside hydrolase [Achlya hypogyna]|uniref:Glycoside hydrolase n=1 Tax=Achlya hypogyna TaxID=1202772 RepID=A0A1V9Z4S2_ACHHY|nr:glycoside hydrolase [Achlya hypogyna]